MSLLQLGVLLRQTFPKTFDFRKNRGVWLNPSSLCVQVTVLGELKLPTLGESQHAAHCRFCDAVRDIASTYHGRVLVVTHGDAVGAIAETLQRGSVVYEVKTTGYIELLQSSVTSALSVVKGVSVGWIA